MIRNMLFLSLVTSWLALNLNPSFLQFLLHLSLAIYFFVDPIVWLKPFKIIPRCCSTIKQNVINELIFRYMFILRRNNYNNNEIVLMAAWIICFFLLSSKINNLVVINCLLRIIASWIQIVRDLRCVSSWFVTMYIMFM